MQRQQAKKNGDDTRSGGRVFRLLSNHDWICYVLGGLYVLSLLLTQPLIYGGDDIGFLRAIEHGQDVPFMSLLLGRFLGAFYQYASPDIPWYSLFLYFVHSLSIGLFFQFMLSFRRMGSFIFFYILLYLLFYSYFIITVSYNNAAIMVGANALFAFLVSSMTGCVRVAPAILYGLLFTFSYLIREPTIKAILVFAFPVLCIAVFLSYKHMGMVKYLAFILPVILCIGVNIYIKDCCVSSAYRQFLEFNQPRGAFHGFNVQYERKYYDKEFLAKNNWSRIDADALNYWFYIDERKFTPQSLQNVLNIPVSPQYFKDVYRAKMALFFERYQVILSFLLFSMMVSLFITTDRWSLYAVILYAVYVCCGMLYMNVVYRFPPRIGLPLILVSTSGMLCIGSIGSVSRIYIKKKNRCAGKRTLFLALAAIGIFFVGLSWLSERKAAIVTGKQLLRATIEQLEEFPEGSFFVGQGLSININYMDPLQPYASFYNNVLFVPGIYPAWTIFSPMYYKVLRQLGIKHGYSLLPFMVNNGKAFFIFWNKTFQDFLIMFAEETLQAPCHLEEVRSLPCGRSVYRLVSGNKVLPWAMFMPAIIGSHPFPWSEYLGSVRDKTSFSWAVNKDVLQ